MSKGLRWSCVTALAFALAGMALQARLPVTDFSVLPDDPFDDVQASVRLSFDTWGLPVADANRIALQAGVSHDDFAVMGFLSNRSGLSLAALWNYRGTGMTWGQIAVRVGVPWDVIVVQPTRDYGPPYGKAWGYWKKQGDARRGFTLSDSEFVRMAQVHTLMRSTGRTADEVIQGFQSGKGYRSWAGETWRVKHGHEAKAKGEKGHGSSDKGNQGNKGNQGKQGNQENKGGKGKGK